MSNSQNSQNPKSTAPANDDRPHWCSDCRAAGKKMRNGPCPGHIKDSKGGGGDDKPANDSASDSLITSGSFSAVLIELIKRPSINAATKDNKDEMLLDTKFDPNLLAELIHGNLKLISIKNEVDMGRLTIKLHPEFLSPNVLSDDVKRELIKFINAIEKELEAFVNQNGIQVNGFTKDIHMNQKTGLPKSFVITFANRDHYENFYKQLDKNVFSTMNNIAIKNVHTDDAKDKSKFNPTPLSTKLEKK